MRDRFELLVHESTGQKYEDLFVKVMGYADASFRPVKAHGNIGDRGNDGWCVSGGKYFQVYAPEDLPSNDAASIRKMEIDFQKLVSYWSVITPIQKYIFVVNDKYKGVSPHIYKAISDLKAQHNLNDATTFLASDLERLLFAQNPDVINSVLGGNSFGSTNKSIYEHLVDEITRKMYLKFWPVISENLIADSIESDIVNGFLEASMVVFKTVLPNTIPSFESSVKNLVDRADALRLHFTDSGFSFLSEDLKWWRRDMRWKKVWIDNQDEFHRKYDLYDNWTRQLYTLHCNFVYALNVFSFEVRNHVDAKYFWRQQFTVVDSCGYETIPSGYSDTN